MFPKEMKAEENETPNNYMVLFKGIERICELSDGIENCTIQIAHSESDRHV